MAQFLRPASDVSAGAWLPSTGGDLYATIDESSPSDGDYNYTESASAFEVALSAGTDPALSTGHVVRYRAAGNGVLDLVVTLMQGATPIASWTETAASASYTDYEHTLSSGAADAITDYSDLSLKFEAAAGGGDPFWANVVALIGNQTGQADASTTFTDQSTQALSISAGAFSLPEWDTAQFPTGMDDSVLFVTANDEALVTGSDNDIRPLTGDFTLEGMVRVNTFGGTNYRNFFNLSGGIDCQIYWNGDDQELHIWQNGADIINGGAVLSTGTWYHLALCRSGTSERLFVDGTQVGSTATNSDNITDAVINVGHNGSNSLQNMDGWISNVRLTKAARYTGSFTPPTLPLPTS